MRYTSILFSGFAFMAAVEAAPASSTSGTLSVPLVRKPVNDSTDANIKREINEPFYRSTVEYLATVEVGTPGQKIQVTLDTGSSDTWVFGPKSGNKQSFNTSNSSSYKHLNVNDGFSLKYGIGSASGDWFQDDIAINGAVVKHQQMGLVGNYKGLHHGVMGLGLRNLESTWYKYDNFPMSLVKQGITKANAYSIYLDDVDSSSGTILFGGIDHGKYSGELFDVSLTKDYRFSVPVTIQGHGGKFNAVLDTGTTYTMLPADVFQSIGEGLGGRWVSKHGIYVFDEIPEDKEVIYDFGTGKIKMRGAELVWKGSDYGYSEVNYFLAAQRGNMFEDYILGDTFMRSAYVFYDLDNKKVSLGQASYSGESNITSIG